MSPQNWPSNLGEHAAKLNTDALGMASAGIAEMPNSKFSD